MNHRKTVGGVPFDDLSAEAIAEKCFAVREKKGFCTVFTPNAVMLARAAEKDGLRRLLATADVSVVDGDGVLLAARREGVRLVNGKTAGVELGKRLLREAARRGESVFLYGGRPGVAEEAARRLRKGIPSLLVAGVCHGYLDEEEAARLIRDSGASLVLVCLGFPKQEQWIAAHRKDVGGILAGLGGSLNVYAGRARRAPRLFRRLHLEWLWRCLLEPRRWRDVFVGALWMARGLRPLALPRGGVFEKTPLDPKNLE